MTKTSFQETADIETSSADYASRFSGEAGEFFLDAQARPVLQCLARAPHAEILDVGGAHCQLARPLIAAGHAVTITGSADICGERAARYLPAGGYTYQTCDSLALPFPNKSFPVVLSFRLLPHVTRWHALIAELCRVSSGIVIMDYPDIRSFNILYHLLFRFKKHLEGNTRSYTLFSRRQIASAFAEQGFKVRFLPQFFWPMVLHRRLNRKKLSSFLEKPCRLCGLTALFGSPVIVYATRNATEQL